MQVEMPEAGGESMEEVIKFLRSLAEQRTPKNPYDFIYVGYGFTFGEGLTGAGTIEVMAHNIYIEKKFGYTVASDMLNGGTVAFSLGSSGIKDRIEELKSQVRLAVDSLKGETNLEKAYKRLNVSLNKLADKEI